jgi:hypothetical protein
MAFSDHIARMDGHQLATFGESVTYAPAAPGVPVTVTGIFDEAFALVDPATGTVESLAPAVWLRLADLPVDPEDDDPTLTIRGRTYRPRQRERDGEGTVRMLLHRVS